MTTPVQTLGPADPNAPLAAKAYTVVSGLLGLVGIAATFGLITSEQAASLGAVGPTATSLIGAVVTAVAAFRTKKQLANGTFTAAPVPPPAPPALTAVDAVKAVQDQFTEFTDKITAGVQNVAAVVPGLTSLIPPAQPAPVTYNIQARDTEDAFIRAQKQERERAAAAVDKFLNL